MADEIPQVEGRPPSDGELVAVTRAQRALRCLVDALSLNASLVVAVVALATAVWSGYLAWDNNRLSVRPLIFLGAVFPDEGEAPGFYIYNLGVGPALIRWATVSLDGSTESIATSESWDRAQKMLGLWGIRLQRSFFPAGYGVSVGAEDSLITISEGAPRSSIRRLREAMSEAVVDICYCSLYEECWQYTWINEQESSTVSSCASHPPSG